MAGFFMSCLVLKVYISHEIKRPKISSPFSGDPSPNIRISKNAVTPIVHLRALVADKNKIDKSQKIPPITKIVIGR